MKTKQLTFAIFLSLTMAACLKAPDIENPPAPDPAPSGETLSYDARVIGVNCNLPLIEIIRNNDSLVASGDIRHAHAGNNRYDVVNLPAALAKVGTILTLDARSPNADEAVACNGAEFNHIHIAVIKVARK